MTGEISTVFTLPPDDDATPAIVARRRCASIFSFYNQQNTCALTTTKHLGWMHIRMVIVHVRIEQTRLRECLVTQCTFVRTIPGVQRHVISQRLLGFVCIFAFGTLVGPCLICANCVNSAHARTYPPLKPVAAVQIRISVLLTIDV
jgi:hypothetical protein